MMAEEALARKMAPSVAFAGSAPLVVMAWH
ncbi:MAG: hypothetical protein SLRJCFUN_000078 [Candidatus Fervidibacter sp.]